MRKSFVGWNKADGISCLGCTSRIVCDGITTRYEYDAAGRMVKEGNRTYTYGYLDKVMSVRDGANKFTYTYHPDGQLASADYGNSGRARTLAAPQGEDSPSFETFTWDGLALIQRGDEQFINEPHVGGGNPVVSSKDTSYFNDMLGTTVGAKSGKQYSAATLSAFGEDLNHHSSTSHFNSFFTGKPVVEGLGHVFLMRNYRAGLGKWQTADPMGYPDGWNQLAYCNNGVTSALDLWGMLKVYIWEYTGVSGNWGHASMELENGTYISRWPMANTSIEQYRFYVWGFRYIYFAVSIYGRSKEADIEDEGSKPTSTIQVDGLDEEKIQNWWDEAKYDIYGTLDNNCAETVANGLKAGGAETPWWDLTSSWNIVWTPNDVKDYAEAIEIEFYLKYIEVQYE